MTRRSSSPWVVLAAILIGTFAGTMGNSTANVALPAVMEEFGVSLTSGVWVVTLYILLFAVLMPVSGYLGDQYGQRRMYLLGIAVFGLAALGAGLAPSLPWLLGCRALQGVGIAPTLPAVMAIITHTFSPAQRGRAIGFWALANGAGHALGPPLSGFLTQHLGWRAVFLSSLPLCAVNIALVWLLVPPTPRGETRRFDAVGATTLTFFALGGMLALTQGARWGWRAPGTLGLWALTGFMLAAFVVTERRVSLPFVELDLFTNPRYAAATAVIAIQLFCLFGLLLVSPIYLIDVQGWESGAAGLLILPLPLTMAVMAPVAGRLADARGSRWTCTSGMAIVVLVGLVGSYVAGGGQRLPWWVWTGGLLVMGVGMGLVQSPAAAAVTHVVPADKVGLATGIFHMCRFVSGTLGTTAFGLILEASGDVALGFRRAALVLAILAVVATVSARGLPGRQARTLEV